MAVTSGSSSAGDPLEQILAAHDLLDLEKVDKNDKSDKNNQEPGTKFVAVGMSDDGGITYPFGIIVRCEPKRHVVCLACGTNTSKWDFVGVPCSPRAPGDAVIVLYSTVRYRAVLYSIVQYCTVLYSTVQYCTVLHSTVQTGSVLAGSTGSVAPRFRFHRFGSVDRFHWFWF